jgi:H+/Cl- antiporter ClcA
MGPSDSKLPQKKSTFRWQFVLIAVCGIAFGLYSLGKHLLSPDPEFTQGYLIFSVVLDAVIIVACAITIILFVIQKTSWNDSGQSKR